MAEKSVVRTESAPAPFQGAPYSQAIKAGGLVFVSGQLALLPGHSEISGDSIQEQTERVDEILADGASKARRMAGATIREVRDRMGLLAATPELSARAHRELDG